jgi:hypothetical protein
MEAEVTASAPIHMNHGTVALRVRIGVALDAGAKLKAEGGLDAEDMLAPFELGYGDDTWRVS